MNSRGVYVPIGRSDHVGVLKYLHENS